MKYKNLVVSGCSFTADADQYLRSWAQLIADRYNLNLTNLALPGAGNQYIADIITHSLSTGDFNPDDTLVGVMWSGIVRQGVLASPDALTTLPAWVHYREVNKGTVNIVAGDLKRRFKITPSLVKNDPELKMIELAYFPSDSVLVTQSWLSITYLTAFLKSAGFNFFQTSFYDLFCDPNQDSPMKNINFQTGLDQLKLNRSWDNWLELKHNEHLGEYCYDRKLTQDDGAHPSPEGQREWTSNVLIPNLSKLGLLPVD